MTEKRPLTQINTKSPGSDVAAEAAAASMVFKSNPSILYILMSFFNMPRSYLLLLIPIEALQVTAIQSSKTTIILLVLLMNSYGQPVGSIIPPETRHISVMLLCRMEKIMLIGESQHGSVGMTNFRARRFAWTELNDFIFQDWTYQSYLYIISSFKDNNLRCTLSILCRSFCQD
jgi:hypothetical protein